MPRLECHLYSLLPTWRVISLDNAMFVAAFGETHEGHTSLMYRLVGSPHGDLAERLYHNPHPDPDKWRRGYFASATFEIGHRQIECGHEIVSARVRAPQT